MILVRKSLPLFSLFLIVILASSCNKPDETGLGVQPATDLPGVSVLVDSSLKTYTVKEDSIVSSSTLSPLLLGNLNDPETGITYASFYSQVRLGGAVDSLTFKGATTPDAVELKLGLVSDLIYGAAKQMHHISVYQLNEKMSKDSIYYSTDSFAVGNMIGHADIVPLLGYNSNVEVASILKIPLDTAFGGYLMREFNSRRLSTNVTLLDTILKGIYVIDSVDGTGNIIGILPTSSLNKMIIYYHDTTTTPDKKFELYLNSGCARSLHFKHEYCNSSGVSPQVCNPPSGNVNHDTVYVQSLAGLKTKVIMPDWNQVFQNKKVSIDRADLIFSVKSGTDVDPYKPHDSFYLLGADSTGKNTTTYDFGDIGGTYNTTTKEYKLNLTRHLQRILNGSVKDYGLYISTGLVIPTSSGVLIIPSNARRTVLNGGTSMKISITYTQQKD